MKNNILNTIKTIHPTNGMIGVEIEVEGSKLPQILPSWRIDVDPSVKNWSKHENYEYVIPKPTDLIGVKAALDELELAYKMNNSKVVEGELCGVHVHLNVQEWSLKKFYTFLICYYIIEEVLTTYCGPAREGNHFCLRAQDAEFILFQIRKTICEKNFKYLNNENIRYATCNLYSLFKYGSLEFRAMRSTRDLAAIYTWCEILTTLAANTGKFNSPLEAISQFSGDGELLFLKTLLGKHAPLFTKVPDLEKKIRNGARRAQIIAYATDWNTYKDEKVNPFK